MRKHSIFFTNDSVYTSQRKALATPARREMVSSRLMRSPLRAFTVNDDKDASESNDERLTPHRIYAHFIQRKNEIMKMPSSDEA